MSSYTMFFATLWAGVLLPGSVAESRWRMGSKGVRALWWTAHLQAIRVWQAQLRSAPRFPHALGRGTMPERRRRGVSTGRWGWSASQWRCFCSASVVLKAVSPGESATVAAGYSIPPWLTVAAVQLELLVAAALVFGCWQWWSLRLTGGLFSVFAAFSLYRAVAGYESCGCFGAVKVNPWITFVLDLVVLGCLGVAVKRFGKADRPREDARRAGRAAAAYVFAGSPILAIMLWTGPTTLGSNGGLVKSGEFVILDPEGWIGEAFPLTAYLSPEVDVTRGDWTVFVCSTQSADAPPIYRNNSR